MLVCLSVCVVRVFECVCVHVHACVFECVCVTLEHKPIHKG